MTPIFSLFAQTSSSTGFIDGPVWADSVLVKGERIRLYAALFNGENSRVDFKVEFFDGTKSIGKAETSIWPKEAKAVSVDWVVEDGRHNIHAKIVEAKIDTKTLDLKADQTKKLSFNVGANKDEVKVEPETNTDSEDVSTEFSNLINKINFKSGSSGDKVKTFVLNTVDKIESWRKSTKSSLDETSDKIKESRKDVSNMKSEVKAMSFLHLAVVQILKFIFSVGTVFYSLGIILGVIVLRKIFHLLGRLFRRNPEMA